MGQHALASADPQSLLDHAGMAVSLTVIWLGAQIGKPGGGTGRSREQLRRRLRSCAPRGGALTSIRRHSHGPDRPDGPIGTKDGATPPAGRRLLPGAERRRVGEPSAGGLLGTPLDSRALRPSAGSGGAGTPRSHGG